jgi:hypothetical protein
VTVDQLACEEALVVARIRAPHVRADRAREAAHVGRIRKSFTRAGIGGERRVRALWRRHQRRPVLPAPDHLRGQHPRVVPVDPGQIRPQPLRMHAQLAVDDERRVPVERRRRRDRQAAVLVMAAEHELAGASSRQPPPSFGRPSPGRASLPSPAIAGCEMPVLEAEVVVLARERMLLVDHRHCVAQPSPPAAPARAPQSASVSPYSDTSTCASPVPSPGSQFAARSRRDRRAARPAPPSPSRKSSGNVASSCGRHAQRRQSAVREREVQASRPAARPTARARRPAAPSATPARAPRRRRARTRTGRSRAVTAHEVALQIGVVELACDVRAPRQPSGRVIAASTP